MSDLDAAPGGRHPAIAAAVQQADRWLAALAAELGAEPRDAYLALRAALHALRDRLQPADAIRLGARLPTLVRGVWFERFDAAEPRRADGFAEVCAVMRQRLPSAARARIDAAAACAAVLGLVEGLIASGDLPADARALLPRVDAAVAARSA